MSANTPANTPAKQPRKRRESEPLEIIETFTPDKERMLAALTYILSLPPRPPASGESTQPERPTDAA